MKAPGFWRHDGLWPRVLQPVAALYAAGTRRRVARAVDGLRASVPVVCCGGVTAGGAGKTTVVLDLLARLHAHGVAACGLTRGYGGRLRGPVQVDAACHTAGDVGDEALLMAHQAPCWVARDRAAGALAAIQAGAQALVLDDGLQNPSLLKDCSFLVVDGGTGFGNGRVIPAGPLREPVAAGAARCRAAVLIGVDQAQASRSLPAGLEVLRAHLVPGPGMRALHGQRVFAMAGIAFPAKFHASLREVGAELVGHRDFADHHPFSEAELRAVMAQAAALAARPVTTAKDAMRLPPDLRPYFLVADIVLEWENPTRLETLLHELIAWPAE